MNYGKKHDLPFGIMDVAGLLRLNIRRRAPGQVYVDCPICGDRRGKMNLNTVKDLWRCNYCGEGGGMLSLYAKVYGVSNSDAYREICDALAVNGFSPDYGRFQARSAMYPYPAKDKNANGRIPMQNLIFLPASKQMVACCGEENLSGILTLRPPASITSMSL